MKIFKGKSGHYAVLDGTDDARLATLKRVRIHAVKFTAAKGRVAVNVEFGPLAVEKPEATDLTKLDTMVELDPMKADEKAIITGVTDWVALNSAPSAIRVFDPDAAASVLPTL